MSYIKVQDIFDPKAKRFAGGQDSEDFNQAFDYALVRSVEVLNSPEVGLSGIEIPDGRDGEIELEYSSWYGVLCDFVDYFLQDTGQWGADDPDRAEAKFRRAKGRAHTIAMQTATTNARVSGHSDDDSDDETL